jgi:hypothetical protein
MVSKILRRVTWVMSFVDTPLQLVCGPGQTPVDQVRFNDYGDLRDQVPDPVESRTDATPPNTKVTTSFEFVT